MVPLCNNVEYTMSNHKRYIKDAVCIVFVPFLWRFLVGIYGKCGNGLTLDESIGSHDFRIIE